MRRLGLSLLAAIVVLTASGLAQDVLDPDYFLETKGLIAFPLRVPSMFDFTGGGARAQGMGNAFLAVSDDASALTWNPAGLYGQEKPILGFGYGSFTPDGKYDLALDIDPAENIEPRNQSYNRDGAFDDLTMLTFMSPLRIKGHPFVGAVGYSRADDEYDFVEQLLIFQVDFNLLDDDPTLNDSTINYEVEYNSGLDVINIGFGTRLSNKVSFGVSTNVYTNKSTTKYQFTETMDGIVLGGIGGLQPLHYVRDLIILDTTWYSGVNFTVGLKYADEKLLAGLVFKSPFTLRQKTNRTADYYERANGNTTGGTPIKIHFDNIHTRLEIPMLIGGGLGYRLKENFLVTADAEYRPFSGGKMKLREAFEIIPGEKDRETFSEHDPLWKDVFTFRTGAEYTWITGSKAFPRVPVRAGFASVPIPTVPIVTAYAYVPVPVEFYDPDLLGDPSRVTATSFSFGTGVHWTQIQLDVAYTYTKLDRNTGQEGADFKNKNGHLNFTFTGVF